MTRPAGLAAPVYYRWLVFGLLAFGYLLVFFHRLCPAVVALDLMESFEAGGGLIGLLASAYFYPYALMQIPSGLLSDTWGPRKTITSFFILAGISSIAFGCAGTASWAIVARVFVGIGVSMLFVPIMKILTQWFAPAEFSFMTGLLIATGGLGALSAATPLAYFSTLMGWRGCFILIGILTLVVSVTIWVWVRNTPEELGYAAIRKDTSPQASQSAPRLWQGVRMVLTSTAFWPLALWYMFNFGFFFSFSGLWGGPFFMEMYALSKAQAGGVLSLSAVGMVVGSPVCSYLSDRVLRSRKKMLVISSAVMFLLAWLLAFRMATFTLPGLYLWSFLFGWFGCAVVVVGFAATKESFPVSMAGTSVGLMNAFPFLGGAVMQPVIGFMLDRVGKDTAGYSANAYSASFTVYVIITALALLCVCFMKETLRPERTPANAL
jgi:sugar phosphate permease